MTCSFGPDVLPSLVRNHPYQLLFATGTGSRVFGIASPDSDYDVHGVHLLPLAQVLGLQEQRDETVERKVLNSDGAPFLEMSTHDLKKFITLLLKGNGNVLEDLYSPYVIETSPVHDLLLSIGRRCITKKCALHYKGMAFNQQRTLKNNEVKKLLHMYRCLLMGIHLMRTGEIEMHVPNLVGIYGPASVLDLIDLKKAGATITPHAERHLTMFPLLVDMLEQAALDSHLPEQASRETRLELEHVLIQARMIDGDY